MADRGDAGGVGGDVAGGDRPPWPAVALVVLAAAETVATVVGVLVTGVTFAAARDSFLISNATIGTVCALCGGLIAVHRPRNALGWLLLGVAVAQTATAAITPWIIHAVVTGDATAVTWTATVYSAAWPWAVGLFLPLAVLVFPDGRFPWRARWPLGLIVANGVLQVLTFSADPYPLAPVAGFAPGEVSPAWSLIAVPGLDTSPLGAITNILLAATYLAGVVTLVLRYRRGNERTRRQVLWPLLGAVTTVVTVAGTRAVWSVARPGTGFPVIATLAVALIPVAITIAVLRHQLLDIRLLWSRAVTYLVLTLALVATYAAVVDLVSGLAGPASSIAATVVVAAAFNPIRVRLQRLVDGLLYGDRGDPVRAVSSVTEQLATGADRPPDLLPAVCQALKLPWAALVVAGERVGEVGARPPSTETFPLRHAGRTVGELRVGVRSGQARLGSSDRAVLELMALPIGVALHAETLSDAVRRSRQEIVAAREEERRRLRRDLHDGLASVLTGVAFQADAVVTLADGNRDARLRIAALGEDIHAGVTGALADVRRLINELHPTALHELGLVEAVRRHARRLTRDEPAPLAFALPDEAADDVGELPAAVEVAAYRILVEALTNVARHAGATHAEVEIRRCEADLVVGVQDDGPGGGPTWCAGVGLRSMVERAEELGGSVSAAPTPAGGRVRARLPLVAR
ncbi:sensor histidine kinase [Actinomycetospora sp. CA-053990]|uniref:sensor histidine kinase n=1 Tax=Actinomycetospora sp. CA-053990 TaxID=3239891 RepID=UPI003D8B3C32